MAKKPIKKKTLELYRKYRPTKLSEVVGQKTAVDALKGLVRRGLPHAIVFAGPSGCGKTTLARIVRHRLRCGDHDFNEVNGANLNGVDMVRGINERMGLAPIDGNARVWLIDEAHQMTTAAQNAFLKMLEDTPDHVYFMLATTDPHKLLKTVQTRCTKISVNEIADADIYNLLGRVAAAEDIDLHQIVGEKIVTVARGSARQALVLLNTIAGMDDESKQLDAIVKGDVQAEAISICRALNNPRTTWAAMAKILKETKTENPEGVRYLILAYFTTVLLGRTNPRAYAILDAFRDNFYDSKRAGLVMACYEIVEGRT